MKTKHKWKGEKFGMKNLLFFILENTFISMKWSQDTFEDQSSRVFFQMVVARLRHTKGIHPLRALPNEKAAPYYVPELGMVEESGLSLYV